MTSLTTITANVPESFVPPCEKDPEKMFPTGSVQYSLLEGYEDAKAVCSPCQLKDKCREFAVSEKITEGVWGETSPLDRGYYEFGVPRNDEDFWKYVNYAKYYSQKQVQELLGLKPDALRKKIVKGQLAAPAFRVAQRPFWRKTDITEYLKEKETA